MDKILHRAEFTYHKQYLLALFFSRKVKKTQSILQYFLFSLKRKDSQTLNSNNCKKCFQQCVCYWYNLRR